jgi:hypothetical protein
MQTLPKLPVIFRMQQSNLLQRLNAGRKKERKKKKREREREREVCKEVV